jgi:hypothetical protein
MAASPTESIQDSGKSITLRPAIHAGQSKSVAALRMRVMSFSFLWGMTMTVKVGLIRIQPVARCWDIDVFEMNEC